MAGVARHFRKWLEMAKNRQKWKEGWKWLEMEGNGCKKLDWLEMAGNRWKWLDMAGNSLI